MTDRPTGRPLGPRVAAGDLAVVLVTVPTAEMGATMGRTLVEEKLAACVNLVPGVRSIYLWQDKLCEDGEVLCLIKTRRDRLPALQARLGELHPYDVPEILAIAPESVNAAYRDWLLAGTRS